MCQLGFYSARDINKYAYTISEVAKLRIYPRIHWRISRRHSNIKASRRSMHVKKQHYIFLFILLACLFSQYSSTVAAHCYFRDFVRVTCICSLYFFFYCLFAFIYIFRCVQKNTSIQLIYIFNEKYFQHAFAFLFYIVSFASIFLFQKAQTNFPSAFIMSHNHVTSC